MDIPIPKEAGSDEANSTFGMLKLAQAYGDAEALQKAGREVISFTIPEVHNKVISSVAEKI
jgi:hypothetical protein